MPEPDHITRPSIEAPRSIQSELPTPEQYVAQVGSIVESLGVQYSVDAEGKHNVQIGRTLVGIMEIAERSSQAQQEALGTVEIVYALCDVSTRLAQLYSVGLSLVESHGLSVEQLLEIESSMGKTLSCSNLSVMRELVVLNLLYGICSLTSRSLSPIFKGNEGSVAGRTARRLRDLTDEELTTLESIYRRTHLDSVQG